MFVVTVVTEAVNKTKKLDLESNFREFDKHVQFVVQLVSILDVKDLTQVCKKEKISPPCLDLLYL